MAIRITCIRKENGFHENPYTAIRELGWTNELSNTSGISTRVQIYDWIAGGGVAYVMDFRGNKAFLQLAISPRGNKYLKTVADAIHSDNLLSLPECQ